MWSKNTHGPTRRRAIAGSSRSTLKPPRSRLRPATMVSIAEAVEPAQSGSLVLSQLTPVDHTRLEIRASMPDI
jgi:hypothetical protein